MNLKDIAAADLAWVMVREQTYRDDGAPVPEPVRRLGALARAIQDAPVPESSVSAASLESAVNDWTAIVTAIEKCGKRLGIRVPGSMNNNDAIAVLAETEKRAANGDALRSIIERCDRALTDSASVLMTVARDLKVLSVAGEGPVLSASAVAPSDLIQLRHGLVLRQRKNGHRALFSEVEPGVFCYVWVSQDGKSGTEPARAESNWRANEWEACADEIGVAPMARPGNGPCAPVAGDSGLIKDWAPSADEMAKSGADLRSAMDKAGLKVDVDVARLVEKFKTEKGGTSAKRPGMAFYHWACRELKGTVT